MNGAIIAEQIRAQIFIDGWAIVAPGDPALAADLARRAASVSHGGEAVYDHDLMSKPFPWDLHEREVRLQP